MALQWSHQPELVEGLASTERAPWEQECFNGATSRSWWKGRRNGRGGRGLCRASMEPPAGAGGRRDEHVAHRDRSRLQWSHQPELVEGSTPSTASSTPEKSLQWSHQPELVEGRPCRNQRSEPRQNASMEPPAGAGGRLLTLINKTMRQHAASMEPPAGAGGRSAPNDPTAPPSKPLQWSHQPELVEGQWARTATASDSDRFNGATSRSWWKDLESWIRSRRMSRLQWSHQPELVEGARVLSRVPRRASASMEPPAGAGGRRQRSARSRRRGQGFNGATSRSWWKAAAGSALARGAREASMEPPAGAGGRRFLKAPIPTSRRMLQWSHQPELVEGSFGLAIDTLAPRLQWSHQPELVEGRPVTVSYEVTFGLQWSHQPELVEGSPTACRWWNRRQGFNGATSRSWWKGCVGGAHRHRLIKLQWSHQPELVEGVPFSANVPPVVARLQWSHQPELVEGGAS